MTDVKIETEDGVVTLPILQLSEDRANNVLTRITKGLLYTFYPDIDYKHMIFKVTQLNPTQELADWMYSTMLYDERGKGQFRFWRLVMNDPPHRGIWAYIFYDGQCFSVSHEEKQ